MNTILSLEAKKVSQALEKKYSVCTVCTVCICSLQSAWTAFWGDRARARVRCYHAIFTRFTSSYVLFYSFYDPKRTLQISLPQSVYSSSCRCPRKRKLCGSFSISSDFFHKRRRFRISRRFRPDSPKNTRQQRPSRACSE